MRYVSTLLVAVLFIGCAMSHRMDKREAYVEKHELDPQTKRAILDGRLVEGMSHDAVVASLGKYDKYNRSVTGSTGSVQLVYDGPDRIRAYVYLGDDGRVRGWQNVCQLPTSCVD